MQKKKNINLETTKALKFDKQACIIYSLNEPVCINELHFYAKFQFSRSILSMTNKCLEVNVILEQMYQHIFNIALSYRYIVSENKK